jgi:hypothetical protein
MKVATIVIGVVELSHDECVDIRRPQRFCYGRPFRFGLSYALYGLGMGVDSQETNCTFGPRFAQTEVNNKCGRLSCPFCVTS